MILTRHHKGSNSDHAETNGAFPDDYDESLVGDAFDPGRATKLVREKAAQIVTNEEVATTR